MKRNKKDTEKLHKIILTKPETIFNYKVAKSIAREQKQPYDTVCKLLKGLLKARADFVEDRPRIFGLLIDTWRYAAANVGGLADMIMTSPESIETDEQYVRSVIAPYCALNNFVTGALIGEMTSAEELEFTITSGILASNWSKLFLVIDSRGISDHETIAKAESHALTLNHNLTEIYHSCMMPILSAEWLDAYNVLESTLTKILKDLASYDPVKGALAI